MPAVSIIIPVYNAEKTLNRCLKSIFNQSYSNFEVIAVNDGSTDNSQAILDKFTDKVTIINQSNQGAPTARNAGAKIAQGQYLLFVDSDTELDQQLLKKMIDALERNIDASYVYSSFKFGNKVFSLWPFNPEKLKKMPYIHTTSLIRQKHFTGFDINLKRFQDWDLWLTMLQRGYQGYFIPEILFWVDSGGTMSRWLPKLAYKLPWLKTVQEYKLAKKIIIDKHNL